MFFCSRVDTNVWGTSGSGYENLVKSHIFGPFSSVLYAITHCVWVLWRYKRSCKSWVRLRGPRQNLQILHILSSFVCYYSLILGPGAIQTCGNFVVRLKGTSSKFADFIHSGQFRVLLLSDFGPQGDPNTLQNLATGYGDPIKIRRFNPFWSVFYAIAQCFFVPG